VPFYDYVCEDCGYEMEVMHSVHEHGPGECPRCQGHMRNCISAPAVHFKGTGWARTSRKSKAARADAKETKPTEGVAPSSDAGSGASPSKDPDR
jgi:putative FmdB family regulatory protein